MEGELQKLFLLLKKNVKSSVAPSTWKLLEVANCFVVWKCVPLRGEIVVFSRKEIVS